MCFLPLQVMVPHIEHVLPMIPGGATFRDIITEGGVATLLLCILYPSSKGDQT
jgi:hypothetical protein